MTDRIVTIFGGSGFLGRHIVRLLARRGMRIRVAVRRPHLAHFLKPMGDVGQIQLMQADLRKPASLRPALAGASDAVNLVGLLHESWGQSFAGLHTAGAQAVAQAAADAGVTRLVQMSSLGVDATSRADYARTKAQGEAAVRAAFPGAVILRPSVVFGPEDQFFNRFADMARFSPALPLVGGGHTRFQPVYVEDVAEAVAAVLTQPGHAGRIFELGGPGIYTFREILELILRVTERRAVLVPLPFALAKLIGFFAQILPNPPLTPDQVELLKTDNVVGAGGPGLGTFADLGIRPESPEAIVPRYLVRFRRSGQFDRPA